MGLDKTFDELEVADAVSVTEENGTVTFDVGDVNIEGQGTWYNVLRAQPTSTGNASEVDIDVSGHSRTILIKITEGHFATTSSRSVYMRFNNHDTDGDYRWRGVDGTTGSGTQFELMELPDSQFEGPAGGRSTGHCFTKISMDSDGQDVHPVSNEPSYGSQAGNVIIAGQAGLPSTLETINIYTDNDFGIRLSAYLWAGEEW